MGYLAVSYNFQGETGYIVAVVRKTTAPLVEIDREVTPAPHSQHSWLIENLDPVWHTVKFYRSVDGTTLDEEILTLAGNALTGSIYPITRYEYVVNRGYTNLSPVVTGTEVWADPVADDTGIRDERLLNKTYWVEERGTGTLLRAEITDRSDAGGGFDFTVPGKIMWDGNVYIISVIERVDEAPVSGGGSSDYNDIVELTADLDFNPALHASKILIANWASNIGTLTMPNFSLLPDCKFKLQTHGGTQSFVGIQLDAGDVVEFLKDDKNIIWLGSGEEIEILIKDNWMYIVSYQGDYRRVGQRVWGDVDDMELNAVVRDGTRYNVGDYPRLVEWISVMGITTVAEGTGTGQWGFSQVVDSETIYPNKGKFTLEGGMIRVPDDRDRVMMALKNTDGTTDSLRQSQGAGSFQKNTFKSHTHDSRDGFGYGGYQGGSNTFSRYRDVTDPFQSAGLIEETGDDKTRMDNTGMIPLLIV
jgi:hypothetical protein